jgi:molybdopterin molybdotransferase
MLETLVRRVHAEPLPLGVARDDRKTLADRLNRGLSADVLCISGGVSMGSTDFVPEALASCGVQVVFRRIAIKPGKPTMFGVAANGTCVFALPGNPLAGFVVFELLVKAAIEAREGRQGPANTTLAARLGGTLGTAKSRQSYWPARVTGDGNGGLLAEALLWSGSSDVFGFSDANGLIIRPPDAPPAQSGETVKVMPLNWS